MTWKTPGIWEEIPLDANVHAERKGTVILGVVRALIRHGGNKYLKLAAPPFGTLTLDARDHWDVTYEVPSLGDEIRSAPVGSTFVYKGTRELIKITEEHVAHRVLVDGYWSTPEVRLIKDFNGTTESYTLRPAL